MKKINKSAPPNPLSQFSQQHPDGAWDNDFREHNAGASYKSVRRIMLTDQGGLCGYCERRINDLPEHHQRVEHYHNKADHSDPTINWGLDWNNVFAVCIGGSIQPVESKQPYPLPANLSCDAHKDRLVTKGQLPQGCEGYFLNPLKIIATPALFHFNKASGEFSANEQSCQRLAGVDNCYQTLQELVEKTIEILNLNCDRLCADRLKVLKLYNQEVAKARKINDQQVFAKLAERWFRNRWPSFFTTRRILLGKHAETYLTQIAYNG